MRILIGLAMALLLGGCVSPSDLERNEPSIKVSTKKEPKQYALCVLPRWQDARSDVSMSETEHGYRLVAASSNMTDELLSIKKSSSGSSVSLYQRMAWGPGYGRGEIERAVKECL